MATAAEADTRYLTVQDVADRYRVSTQAVKNWIKAGKLGAAKPVGRQWLIEPEELARFESGTHMARRRREQDWKIVREYEGSPTADEAVKAAIRLLLDGVQQPA